MALKCFVLLICATIVAGNVCPKECDCDTNNGLNRAACVDQNIISIDVGVPKGVEIYSLRHNVISELNNRCFMDLGYTSIKILDLSYNRIFWIGLHAFAGLDKLVHLDLSNNYLRSFPSDLFWDTPLLDTLDLSSNVFEVLRNEYLIDHKNLKILNLNNCRIRSLPNRVFNRLPNLRKLDLGDNYMVSLSTNVLVPLRKLEQLVLRNEYWQCNNQFKAIETWITSKGIAYEQRCTDITPKMSERMMAMPETIERKQVDVSEIWNATDSNKTVLESPKAPVTPFQKFDEEFSAFQAFIIGMEVGLAIGIVGTYIWLSRFCSCGRLRCSRTPSRQRRRRVPSPRAEGDMRTNLLWSNAIQPDSDTPPLNRRPLSPAPGLPRVADSALQVDAIRVPNRAETPPPPYNECRINL